MKYLLKYNLFNEARLSDVYTKIGTGLTYNVVQDYSDELKKFKTISKRINGVKLRINIFWHDTLKHDIRERIKTRTTIKTIEEFNKLVDNGLEELYIKNTQYFYKNGKYSLWFSEYDFSFIVVKENNNLTFITIIPGMNTNNVINTIELKSTI